MRKMSYSIIVALFLISIFASGCTQSNQCNNADDCENLEKGVCNYGHDGQWLCDANTCKWDCNNCWVIKEGDCVSVNIKSCGFIDNTYTDYEECISNLEEN